MVRLASILVSELKKNMWHSPLQMLVWGILIYYVAMVLGSGYACGTGNSDVARGVFKCSYGTMGAGAKTLIVIGIGVASLCLGRSISLLEKLWYEARQED